MLRKGRQLLKRHMGSEKGQVLILFAAGAMVFLGMLSLVVDVGNLYFVRRDAQATVDAAALVGAQRTQGTMPNVTLKPSDAIKDARTCAVNNGYQTDPAASSGIWHDEVRVDCPPATGPYAGQPDYIEVQIERHVGTLFAGILGADPSVHARAVARCKHSTMEVATLSLNEGDSSTYNGGGSVTNVIGGAYSRGGIKAQAGSLTIDGKAYSRTGFAGAAIFPSEGFVGPPYSAPPPDLFDPKWTAPQAPLTPGSYWDSQGSAEQSTRDADGWLHIYPGTYPYISISPNAKVIFEPGVYHVTGTQGITNNGEIHGNGVCLVMDTTADFSSQSQGHVFLRSSPNYNNIVLWSADCSNNAVKIVGGADVVFQGTIYAPCGTVRLGGSANGVVHGQVVAGNIQFEGCSGTAVVYDDAYTAEIPGPALVE